MWWLVNFDDPELALFYGEFPDSSKRKLVWSFLSVSPKPNGWFITIRKGCLTGTDLRRMDRLCTLSLQIGRKI